MAHLLIVSATCFICLDFFRQCLVSLKFQKFYKIPRHIFGRMHGALNVGKKITNCTVCL
jgi:hypothetical protein